MRNAYVLAAICVQVSSVPICLGQATPFVNSVVNSASYSGHPIAEGSIFTVFGFSLGPSQIVHTSFYPLQFQLGVHVDRRHRGRTYVQLSDDLLVGCSSRCYFAVKYSSRRCDHDCHLPGTDQPSQGD